MIALKIGHPKAHAWSIESFAEDTFLIPAPLKSKSNKEQDKVAFNSRPAVLGFDAGDCPSSNGNQVQELRDRNLPAALLQ